MRYFFFVLCVFSFFWAKAQRIEGMVKGENEELVYCSIKITSSDYSFEKEFTSDLNGRFNINLAKGEYIIQLDYLGYKTLLDTFSLEEQEVKKLNYSLKEEVVNLDIDPIIRASLIPDANTLLINKDNFLKLSGSFNDPTRLLIKFPGISSTNDQSNFISLSGMPPSMAGWFVNGATVVNPNHLSNTGTFTDQASASGGGVNMISGNSIGEFSFVQSPYNSEYFNVGSGLSDFVLDVSEGPSFSIGLLGTELKYGYKKENFGIGVNYRYSTLGILSVLGVPLGEEEINFQDIHIRLFRNGEKYTFSIDAIVGGNSNVHEPLEEINFFRDGLFIELKGRQELISSRFNYFNDRWNLRNTLNYSSRNSTRQIRGEEENIGFTIDSLELINEVRISLKNGIEYFINNDQRISLFNNGELGLIDYRGRSGNYRRGSSIINYTYEKDKWKIEGGYGLSIIGGNTNLGSEDKLGSETRFLLHYGSNKNRVSGRVSRGLISLLPEFMIIGSEIAPMRRFNAQLDYIREGVWGKFKIGGYYHIFRDVVISEGGRVSYFNRFDLIENEILNGGYSNDGEATIIGTLVSHQIEFKDFQLLNNFSYYDLNISQNIQGDFNFNYTFNSTLSYAKKLKNKQIIFSTSFQGRGANREFGIDLDESIIQNTTIYNRTIINRLRPFTRLDLKLSYAWGKSKFNNNKYVLSIDILNLLNRFNDSFSFYDPIRQEVVLNNQLGIIPILKFDYNY